MAVPPGSIYGVHAAREDGGVNAEHRDGEPIDISHNRPEPREGFLRNMKPLDCTCQYPHVICRNMIGHPASCGAYARLYR